MKYLFYDFEIYPNFWYVVFKNEQGQRIDLHAWMNYQAQFKKLEDKLDEIVFVGANNIRYDTVMLNYLLANYDSVGGETIAKKLYEFSQEIIEKETYFRKVMADNFIPTKTKEMDVLTFFGNRMGVKEMACRLHHPVLENLPIPPSTHIEEKHLPILRKYCNNDVDVLIRIYGLVKPEMDAIWGIIDYFGLDKQDCSETIGSLVEKATADPTLKPNPPKKFRYTPPVEFNFKTEQFRDVEETFKGLLLEPESNFSMALDVGDMKVTVGLGGIHGATSQTYYENLIDFDAKQYYPEQIDKYDQIPNTVKNKKVLRIMIDDKERFGEEGDPREIPVKKSINSWFGRLGFSNSKLYAPDKLYNVTITGQLLLLRLTEDLIKAGYVVVYLNTDGLMFVDNGTDYHEAIGEAWAEEFGFKLKQAQIKRAYFRDVNNYVIEMEDGETKRKGDLNTEPKMKRSCFAKVSVDAVVENLLHGVSIRDYINEQDDLRDFLMYHKYNRDMRVFLHENGEYKPLPNVVRYVLADDKENAIVHTKEGKEGYDNRDQNKNARLVPVFEEVDGKVEMLPNIDIERYIRIAYDIKGKVTGKDVEDNPYIEGILGKIETL